MISYMGLGDAIKNTLFPEETEEEKKKRLAREAASGEGGNIYQQRKSRIDEALAKAQK